MIFLIFFPLIVITGDVEITESSLESFSQLNCLLSQNALTAAVEGRVVSYFSMVAMSFLAITSPVGSSARSAISLPMPHYNRRVNFYLCGSGCYVILAPFIEILVIILRTFAVAIGRILHRLQATPVCHMPVEVFRRQIMGTSDCIESVRLHQFHFALFCSVRKLPYNRPLS